MEFCPRFVDTALPADSPSAIRNHQCLVPRAICTLQMSGRALSAVADFTPTMIPVSFKSILVETGSWQHILTPTAPLLGDWIL